MPYTYNYPRASVTVDCVVLAKNVATFKILLIQRGREPFKGNWALPGGFIEMDEELEEAAKRELEEETNLRAKHLKQLFTVGTPGRDPRGRTISVIYGALLNETKAIIANDDAQNAKWFDINQLPQLAFDHDEIIQRAITILTQD